MPLPYGMFLKEIADNVLKDIDIDIPIELTR